MVFNIAKNTDVIHRIIFNVNLRKEYVKILRLPCAGFLKFLKCVKITFLFRLGLLAFLLI